jgi:hypothetical protein
MRDKFAACNLGRVSGGILFALVVTLFESCSAAILEILLMAERNNRSKPDLFMNSHWPLYDRAIH